MVQGFRLIFPSSPLQGLFSVLSRTYRVLYDGHGASRVPGYFLLSPNCLITRLFKFSDLGGFRTASCCALSRAQAGSVCLRFTSS